MRALKSLRYAIGDIVFVIGRYARRVARLLHDLAVAAGRGLHRFWRSLSVVARRRLVAALGVAVLLLVLFSAIVPNLPCELPGGSRCPPAEDAVELVPADALAYAHANLDPETDQYAAASELASELPVLGGELIDRALALVPAPRGTALDFDSAVRPWFGGEAAIAVLDGIGAAPERIGLLEVADGEGAAEYAEALAVGAVATAEFQGVEVTTDRRDVATAQVEGFLAIGAADGVRAVIATATGSDGADSLADDPVATEVRDQLPEHSLAEAFVSADGAEDLIGARRGPLATLAPLVAPGVSRGAAASLSAGDEGLELAVRSSLDPGRERISPSFFDAFSAFEPELPERLPPETLAYIGIGAPQETVAALLDQASAQAPGIAAGVEDLVEGLRRDVGVDVERQLLAALGEEAAFALEPPPDGGGALPYLLFVAAGVEEEDARRALAALQRPLVEAADPGSDLQAPVFGEAEVSGVETNSLRISPTVELTYAVFDELATIATDPAGVAGLIDDQGGLDEQELYQRATEGFPGEVALAAYFDLGGLVTTGERAGLAEDPLYVTFAGDFRRLEALAISVSGDDELLATDARLLVGEAPRAEDAAPPPAPGD